jgi:hypothetical protein
MGIDLCSGTFVAFESIVLSVVPEIQFLTSTVSLRIKKPSMTEVTLGSQGAQAN